MARSDQTQTSATVTEIGRTVLARKGRRPMLVMAVSGLITLAALAGLLFTRMQALELAYEISKRERKYDELTKRHAELKVEINQLATAERVIPAARDRLGLDYPQPRQIVTVTTP